ncbi:MAG TPA: sigma-70 family RNA polymerase sigma factor [Solirubrobacterales bacterium]|jgi:RNA polymerase sigma factor (sigma-70 family)
MPPPAEGFAARLLVGPALRTQPDRRLVALVRDGYELAFEEIVRRYGRPLARYAGAIVGNRADDVTQDAFSKALLALRRDGAEIELRPWLFRIVRNTALNELRDRPPSPELLAEAIAGGSNPAEELERREELTDLMRRLQSLPEPQRAAIVMRELEGLSHEEIAAALGLSGGGARQAIYRARQALREGLGMLLPLPLLRLLIDHGGDAAAVGAGAGAGGAAAASGAGAGMALKAGVLTAVLAGSVGTGIALHGHAQGEDDATAATSPQAKIGTVANPAPLADAADPAPATVEERSRRRGPHDGGSGEAPGGEGHGRGSSGQGSASGDGPGPGSPVHEHQPEEHGGRHGSSGGSDDGGGSPHFDPKGGPTEPGRDKGGGSESGGSGGSASGGGDGGSHDGSGSGDGGHQGSGGGDPSPTELAPPPPPPEESLDGDKDGSGSGGSGSGSSGDGRQGGEELP